MTVRAEQKGEDSHQRSARTVCDSTILKNKHKLPYSLDMVYFNLRRKIKRD
jgi:hypothetical protein